MKQVAIARRALVMLTSFFFGCAVLYSVNELPKQRTCTTRAGARTASEGGPPSKAGAAPPDAECGDERPIPKAADYWNDFKEIPCYGVKDVKKAAVAVAELCKAGTSAVTLAIAVHHGNYEGLVQLKMKKKKVAEVSLQASEIVAIVLPTLI